MKALFVVDDRPEAGQGHVVRMGALAAELESRGWKLAFNSWACSENPDILVEDVPPGAAPMPCHHSALPRLYVMVFDALGTERDEILLDQSALLVCGVASGTQSKEPNHLFGPKYSLLRPEFGAVRWHGTPADSVLDTRHITNCSARGLANALASSAVCITYGGMRAMEAACVGIPMVLHPRNEGEWLNARGLAAHGVAIVCNDESDLEPAAVDLLSRPHEWEAMSANSRQLVDGHGVQRVADAIEEMVR